MKQRSTPGLTVVDRRRHAVGDGEGQREHQWVHEHPWDRSAWPEAALGGLATCERVVVMAQRAGEGPRVAAAGCLRREGAAHDGEDAAVHGRDGGGLKDE